MRSLPTFAVLVWSAVAFHSTVRGDEPSVDELITMLSSGDPFKSASAAKSLSESRTISPSVIDALVKALSDDRIADRIPLAIPAPRQTVASFASDALIAIGEPAVDRLAHCAVGTQDKDTRTLALRTLSRLGHVAHASAPIVETALKDEAYEIRYYAIHTLAAVHRDARRTVEVLEQILSDKSSDVRAAALQALGGLGAIASPSVPEVARLLDDREDRWHTYTPDMIGTRPVRYDAAITLAKIGNDARASLPKLRKMMTDDDEPLVRIAAALAVALLDDDASPAVEVLIRHMDSRKSGTLPPEHAAHALGQLGTNARPALPALTRALEHPEVLVRINAADAIAAIDPGKAKTSLLPLLRDSDDLVRSAVIETLGNLPETSADVIAALVSSLDDKGDVFSTDVRHAAAIALGKRGAKASDALPRLRQIVARDESEWVKEAAENAINQIEKGG